MSTKKALIVDSDEQRAAQARQALQSAGYLVDVAADGWTALVGLQQSAPDLLLVQPRLSIVSGYEVARYARTDQRLAGTRIVMLSDASLTGPAVELADVVLELPLQSAALLQAAAAQSPRRAATRKAGRYQTASSSVAN